MRRVDHPYSVSTDYQRYYWETQWQDYDEEKMLADVRWEGILPVALRVFARGSRLLEAGCGTGKYCLALSRAGRRVVGVDFARAGLVAARHVEPQLGVLQGSVVEMPFRDHCFDGALSLGVVEHFQSGPEAALRELARVIRPGGTLLLTVPFQNLLLELKELFLPTHDNASVADMVFYQYLYRRDEMAACLGKAGFRVAMVKYIGKQLGLSEAGAHVEGVKNATRALARIIHPWTEPDGLDASSRRSDEGAGWRPASEERRPDAPRIGRQATGTGEYSGRAQHPGWKAIAKRHAPALVRGLRDAQMAVVEGLLPGPLCAHGVLFVARTAPRT